MIKLNGHPIKPTLFSDGTSQVWQLEGLKFSTAAYVEWQLESEAEFMQLAQLKTLLDSKSLKTYLYIPFMPYGRQDKDVSNEATFGLTTFARLLNSLNFLEVSTLDPHSGRCLELINNLEVVVPYIEIENAKAAVKPDLFCYPDKGATDKYSVLLKDKFISAGKDRDQLTGKLISMAVSGDCKDKSVLIIDDICDGGGTFCWLASLLLEEGAKEVNLYATHGIFSKGLKPLIEAGINRVFTKDGEISEYQDSICYKEL